MKTEIIREINEENIESAAQVILRGGLVAFPTETVYGLGANALDAEAAKKIYAAKGRPSDNPLIIHLADPRDAEKYCHTNDMYYRLAELFMPGPLTVILPRREIIPKTVTGGLETVAVRVPSHPVAHMLIEKSGVPIAAPSANISGKPSPTSFSHIEHDLDGRVDMLIDGGECGIGVESTIVKIDDDGVTLLRPGGVTAEMLATVCGHVGIDPAVSGKFDGVPMAPGMKYRHYAPDVPLVILDVGHDDDKFFEYIRGRENFGVLCFDEDLQRIADDPKINASHVLSLGAGTDSASHARELFARLREFDECRDIKVIYSRMPSKEGIGFAVFNRLIKASGFTVVKV